MKKIKVGVIGYTGRLGKPLTEILEKHPYVEIVYRESRTNGIDGNLVDAEYIFLALPYGESKNHINRLVNKKVIDLSIDHRDKEDWTYGLSEINSENIKSSDKIANPGCYATSILLATYPIREKIKSVRISSTSGLSGAGIDNEKDDNFITYKEGVSHPQVQEICFSLGIDDVQFVPQRIDSSDRGSYRLFL